MSVVGRSLALLELCGHVGLACRRLAREPLRVDSAGGKAEPFACRQVGPIKFRAELKDGEEVFGRRASMLFKRIQVVRFFDKKRNVLIYLTYSDKLIEGSPKNSVSAVAIQTWN